MVRMLVLMLALMPLLALRAEAASYYVDGRSGCDENEGTSVERAWQTLDRANAALTPGDVCIVRGGVYKDSQIAPERSGLPDAPITYVAYEGEKPEVTGGRSGSIVLLADRSYVTIKGFAIHSATEHDWIVNISGEKAHHNRIEGCDITDPEGYAPVVIADGAAYNTVTGCTVHDTGGGDEQTGDCIVMNVGAHHNTIIGNRCYNGCHSQIMALNGSHHNVIEGNDLYSTNRAWAGAGVNLPLGADANTVVGNRIHDLGYITDEKCAIQIDSADNVIRNNVIHDVGAFGIALQSYAFRGTPQSASNNLVANNTVVNTGRQGLVIISKGESISRNNRVVNNIVVGSPRGWYESAAWIMAFDTYHLKEIVQPGEWFGNVFESNLFLHARAGESDMVLYNHKGPAATWSIPELESAYPETFRGNVEVDPQFVDPANGEFVLKASSPALDAGLDVGSSFQGKAPDIGAVEREAGNP
ncbi:MAG: right-handed parallel beta-helix repeat-containing protein [Armatimonadetes bacterium]|nr:right-handed parallel beta-helix repeat-containing protein [Armatimonadota bacterium]